MSLARHCDGPDCETWQSTNSSLQQRGWLDVCEVESGDTKHFCDWNCAIKFGAQYEPPEIIQLGGA